MQGFGVVYCRSSGNDSDLFDYSKIKNVEGPLVVKICEKNHKIIEMKLSET